MSDYLLDYYIHRQKFAPETHFDHDNALKDLIACLAVHLTVRPSAESHAWTAHFVSSSPFSVFVTGELTQLEDARRAEGYITGNIITENIRHTDVNSLHAQRSAPDGTVYRSYIQSESAEAGAILERFYQQSEQLPLRIFLPRDSDKAFAFAALPDFDEAWFSSTALEGFIPDTNAIHLRSCEFRFFCDCSPDKLMPFFNTLSDEELEELYGEDRELIISCPRCGRNFAVEKKDLEKRRLQN